MEGEIRTHRAQPRSRPSAELPPAAASPQMAMGRVGSFLNVKMGRRLRNMHEFAETPAEALVRSLNETAKFRRGLLDLSNVRGALEQREREIFF